MGPLVSAFLHRVPGIRLGCPISHRRGRVWLVLATLLAGGVGCVPLPGDAGGSQPPPDVNGDDVMANDNGVNPPPVGDVRLYAVTIEASSRRVAGIHVSAQLRLESSPDNDDGELQARFVSLIDEQNIFDDTPESTAINGGLLLTAAFAENTEPQGAFRLTSSEGVFLAVYSETGGGTIPANRFVVQDSGTIFEPGILGRVYVVGPESRFSFRLTGDEIEGSISLIGLPAVGAGDVENFTGTFVGSAL